MRQERTYQRCFCIFNKGLGPATVAQFTETEEPPEQGSHRQKEHHFSINRAVTSMDWNTSNVS